MFWTQGILVAGLTLFTAVLLVGAIVLITRSRGADAFNFAIAVLLSAALLASAVGAAQVLAPVLSAAFGRDFTYDTTSRIGPPTAPASDGSAVPAVPLTSQAEDQYRNDLANGVAILVVGLLLLGALAAGRHYLQKHRPESSLFQRTCLLLILVSTSLVAPISLAIALTQLLRRYVLLPVGPTATPAHPGSALATAIIFVPMWCWFLFRVLRENDERPAEAVPDKP